MPHESRGGPPPMPPTGNAAARDEVSIEAELDSIDEVVSGIPKVTELLLATELVMLLSTLMVPRSVILTLPILIMLGFWLVAIGARLSGRLSFGQKLFSRMGQFSAMLQSIGASPLLLGVFGFLTIKNANEATANLAVRFLVVCFSIFFVPVLLWVRSKAMRHLSKDPMTVQSKVLVMYVVFVGISVSGTAGIFSFMINRGSMAENLNEFDTHMASYREDIDAAHELWDAEERFEAVKEYKTILRTDGIPWHVSEFRAEQPTLYRRVIEHEADYGDPGSARDWALRAYDYGQRNEALRSMTFSSEAATAIWQDVVDANQ